MLSRELNQKGYSVIQNWENPDVVEALLNSIIESNGQLTKDVFTYWTSGRLPSLMLEIFGKNIYDHTCNIKNKNESNFNIIPYHQDSAYILPNSFENKDFLQITCWLPLVDVSIENGTIEIADSFENKQINHNLKNGYMQIDEKLKSTPLILKAGTLVLMHHNLIHGSNVNKTDSIRWSLDFRYQNIQIPFQNMKQGFEIYPDKELTFMEYIQKRARLESTETHKYSLIR